MTITIDPKLETWLHEKAEAEGLTISAYVERLVTADQAAEKELEGLALEGLNSGEPTDEASYGKAFFKEKHRQLDEQLRLKQPIPEN
jgi:hypothetical protein